MEPLTISVFPFFYLLVYLFIFCFNVCLFVFQRVWTWRLCDTWCWTGTGGTRSSAGWWTFRRWATAPCWPKETTSSCLYCEDRRTQLCYLDIFSSLWRWPLLCNACASLYSFFPNFTLICSCALKNMWIFKIYILSISEAFMTDKLIFVFSFWLYICVFNLTCAFLFQIKLDLMKLLDSGIVKCCKEDKVKVGLF